MTITVSRHPTESLRSAALTYVELGWPVLPGPVCDGLASWHPVTAERLGCCEAVVDDKLATTDSTVIERWWAHHPHIVLAATGRQFDVLRVPTPAASQAIALMSLPLGPVALAADGVRFFVEPGAMLGPELAKVHGVELLQAGGLTALPPSRVKPGVVSWWISPSATQGRLGDAESVQAALVKSMRSGSPARRTTRGSRDNQHLGMG
ncbi:bifunctional DNA primase/polymerase [Streptomyces sp. MN03-5084-2B]|nr:bifunctional DNA primase/polymerase [Streptomyces sp. MN03-5084-2B]